MDRAVSENQLNGLFIESLFHYHPDALFVLNGNGNITRWNPLWKDLIGYTDEQVSRLSFLDLLQPHPKLQSIEDLIRIAKSKHPRIELVFTHQKGTQQAVEATFIPIVDQGQLIQLYCIAKPIDASSSQDLPSSSELDLLRTKELFESFISHTKDVISLAPVQGDLFLVSQSIETLLGWSIEEFMRDRNIILPDKEAHTTSWQYYQQVLDTGQAVEFESKRIRKDGKVLNVSLTYSPIHDSTGHIIGTAGILRDITQQKKTEAALREIEVKYKLITENTSDLIQIIDTNGLLIYLSPSHEAILGYSLDELMGTCVYDYLLSDDVEKTVSTVQTITSSDPSMMLEVRVKHKNGEWRLVEASGMPVLDENGVVQNIVVVARDITERKKTDELLRNSEKLSVIGELAAGIAHEIRNPLTSIRGFIQLMQEQSKIQREHLEIMREELDRINLIVSELLVLSKPQIIHFKKNNLQSILTNVLMLLDTQAIMNNVQIQLEVFELLPDIVCEANQVKQVFINIIKNAIEAMPQGGLILIRLTSVENKAIQIQINDQGCGVSEERLGQLGMPFYSTKEKGTGLGLMISKKIIRDHNGSLTITSRLNEGTTVEVLLPIDPM